MPNEQVNRQAIRETKDCLIDFARDFTASGQMIDPLLESFPVEIYSLQAMRQLLEDVALASLNKQIHDISKAIEQAEDQAKGNLIAQQTQLIQQQQELTNKIISMVKHEKFPDQVTNFQQVLAWLDNAENNFEHKDVIKQIIQDNFADNLNLPVMQLYYQRASEIEGLSEAEKRHYQDIVELLKLERNADVAKQLNAKIFFDYFYAGDAHGSIDRFQQSISLVERWVKIFEKAYLNKSFKPNSALKMFYQAVMAKQAGSSMANWIPSEQRQGQVEMDFKEIFPDGDIDAKVNSQGLEVYMGTLADLYGSVTITLEAFQKLDNIVLDKQPNDFSAEQHILYRAFLIEQQINIKNLFIQQSFKASEFKLKGLVERYNNNKRGDRHYDFALANIIKTDETKYNLLRTLLEEHSELRKNENDINKKLKLLELEQQLQSMFDQNSYQGQKDVIGHFSAMIAIYAREMERISGIAPQFVNDYVAPLKVQNHKLTIINVKLLRKIIPGVANDNLIGLLQKTATYQKPQKTLGQRIWTYFFGDKNAIPKFQKNVAKILLNYHQGNKSELEVVSDLVILRNNLEKKIDLFSFIAHPFKTWRNITAIGNIKRFNRAFYQNYKNDIKQQLELQQLKLNEQHDTYSGLANKLGQTITHYKPKDEQGNVVESKTGNVVTRFLFDEYYYAKKTQKFNKQFDEAKATVDNAGNGLIRGNNVDELVDNALLTINTQRAASAA